MNKHARLARNEVYLIRLSEYRFINDTSVVIKSSGQAEVESDLVDAFHRPKIHKQLAEIR